MTELDDILTIASAYRNARKSALARGNGVSAEEWLGLAIEYETKALLLASTLDEDSMEDSK